MSVYQCVSENTRIDQIVDLFVAGKIDRAWFRSELAAHRVRRALRQRGMTASVFWGRLFNRQYQDNNNIEPIWWVVTEPNSYDPEVPAAEMYDRLLELAAKRGIEVTSCTLGSRDPSLNLWGLVHRLSDSGEIVVWLNPLHPIEERVFALAHEIGHVVRGHLNRRPLGKNHPLADILREKQRREDEANEFANRLLRFMERHRNPDFSVRCQDAQADPGGQPVVWRQPTIQNAVSELLDVISGNAKVAALGHTDSSVFEGTVEEADDIFLKLKAIADAEGIRQSVTPELPDSIRGIYFRDRDRHPGIVLNSNLTPQERVFTMAHELGHHFLKHEGNIFAQSGASEGRNEREANAFARHILDDLRTAPAAECVAKEGLSCANSKGS